MKENFPGERRNLDVSNGKRWIEKVNISNGKCNGKRWAEKVNILANRIVFAVYILWSICDSWKQKVKRLACLSLGMTYNMYA